MVSKKRRRKIEFIERKAQEGETHDQLVRRGEYMKMKPEDLQQALGKNIYPGVRRPHG